MTSAELHWMSIREMLARFHTGELTPLQVLDHHIERIERLDKSTGINAVIDLQVESARELAREAGERFRLTPDSIPEPPLLGIPFLVKEQHDVAGLSATRGSQARQGMVAEKDHEIVERLKSAGAIPFGRTATPELSCATFTHTREWGVTRNPYNLDKTPGRVIRRVGRRCCRRLCSAGDGKRHRRVDAHSRGLLRPAGAQDVVRPHAGRRAAQHRLVSRRPHPGPQRGRHRVRVQPDHRTVGRRPHDAAVRRAVPRETHVHPAR